MQNMGWPRRLRGFGPAPPDKEVGHALARSNVGCRGEAHGASQRKLVEFRERAHLEEIFGSHPSERGLPGHGPRMLARGQVAMEDVDPVGAVGWIFVKANALMEKNAVLLSQTDASLLFGLPHDRCEGALPGVDLPAGISPKTAGLALASQNFPVPHDHGADSVW